LIVDSICKLVSELVRVISAININKFNSINKLINELILRSEPHVIYIENLTKANPSMTYFWGNRSLCSLNLSFFLFFKWNIMIVGSKHHIYMIFFGAWFIIFPFKGINGCILFNTLSKPLKNGSYHVFLIFYQILEKKINIYKISKFDAKMCNSISDGLHVYIF